ncbi:MAG: molecular chaperone DnaJ, partial [Firmicutes bacterium]|nr:molecular chaperone DnaJ [Bacillota bacterium]
QKGRDIFVDMTLSFMEAAKGCSKTVSIKTTETCDHCHGTGAAEGTTPKTCQRCHGTGQVVTERRGLMGTIMRQTTVCPECRGTGKTIEKPCTHCNGTGEKPVTKKLKVDIPAGIDSEESIPLRGYGNAGKNGGPAGDAYVEVRVQSDPMFQRSGYDVAVELPVSYADAVLGADVVVPTIDGKIKFTVPEATQSETVFRLKGKGIPNPHRGGRGDQYVTVRIEVPKKLTKEQKTQLREFDSSLANDKNYDKKKSFADRLKKVFGKDQ